MKQNKIAKEVCNQGSRYKNILRHERANKNLDTVLSVKLLPGFL